MRWPSNKASLNSLLSPLLTHMDLRIKCGLWIYGYPKHDSATTDGSFIGDSILFFV